MSTLLRSFLLAIFVALALITAPAEAETNAERFARGLPPLPPYRRDANTKRKYVSPAPPAPTTYPTTNGGYANTCVDVSLSGLNNHIISSTCKRFDGAFVSEDSININKCFSNVGGQLKCSSSGGATNHECNSCTMSGTILTCNCLTGAIHKPLQRAVSSIDTNKCLTNRDGKLMCY